MTSVRLLDMDVDASSIIYIILTIILAMMLLYMATGYNYIQHIYTHQATATITAANCVETSSPYECTLAINYTPNRGPQQTNLVVKGPSTKLLNIGSTVTIYYNPSNLSEVSLTKYITRKSNSGFGMLIAGLLILVVPFLLWNVIFNNSGKDLFSEDDSDDSDNESVASNDSISSRDSLSSVASGNSVSSSGSLTSNNEISYFKPPV